MIINKLLFIGIITTLINISDANYTLNILLNEFNNGQGFLADGSHCDVYWFAGHRCDIQLVISVNINGSSLNSQAIDLGNVTSNANSIVFGEQVYGSWYNPHSEVHTGQYSGFSLSVKATEAKNGKLIDQFTTDFISSDRINDFTYFSHPRLNGNLEPTMISFAWFVQGDVASPQPTGPPPTTTTTKQPVSGIIDCEAAYAADDIKESGPFTITLANGEKPTVYCEIDTKVGSAQTVFQSRGSVASSKAFETLNFDAYQTEQGSAGPDNDYWMGLDNLNMFTTGRTARYNMSIIACCGNKTVITQIYNNVTVSDKASGYVLDGTASISSTGLGYKRINMDLKSKFRAYDNFNTTTPATPYVFCSIAQKSNENNLGGWWFGNCLDNLNGHYYPYDPKAPECDLTDTQISEDGPGIELHDIGSYTPAQIIGKSYTRVRMAFYRANGKGFSANTGFCNDIKG